MRKNDHRFLILWVLLFALLFTHAPSALALRIDQQLTNPDSDVFTFAQLGYQERILLSPYDTLQIPFGLPSNWALIPGSEITLRYHFASNRAGQSLNNQDFFPAGTLRVSFNGVTLRTIPLTTAGEVTEIIPIPAEALTPDTADGRYRLSFLFDSRFSCDDETITSSLIISSGSSIDLKHQIIPLKPDLTIFPRPLYQPNSIIPSRSVIVIPDSPSEAEMRAALSISAGLGALTNGRMEYSLIPVSQFSDAQKAEMSVILVGLPQNLALFKQIDVPYRLQNGQWVLKGMELGDGLVQMAVSPWNSGNVVLVVSANSEEGLVKAAQAVSTGTLIPTGQPNVSVVSAVNPTSLSEMIPADQTLFSLGYENKSLGGFEGNYASYFFPASSEQVLSIGGYIDLVSSHTNLLDFERSGITVYLNSKFIGSLKFTGDVDQVSTTRLNLLPGIIRRGSNLLEIYSDLVPIYDCYSPALSSNVVVISGLTNIHLPDDGQQLALNTLVNLSDYPTLFTSDRNLGDLAFVLARNDPVGWDVASRIAFNIGASASIPIANLEVAFGDSVSETIRNERGLIIVGRPSKLPIIAELNNKLPAPFDVGSDEAIQPALLVNYRLLPGVSVGYLQLVQSPWNANHFVLVVSGNTEAGLPMAGEKLINPQFNSQLNGNFSLLYQDQVLTTDTRLGQSKEPLISNLPVESLATPVPQEEPVVNLAAENVEIETRPAWILPAIIALSVLTFVMVLIFVSRALMANRFRAPKKVGDSNPGSH